jgi:hypothetical protein
MKKTYLPTFITCMVIVSLAIGYFVGQLYPLSAKTETKPVTSEVIIQPEPDE